MRKLTVAALCLIIGSSGVTPAQAFPAINPPRIEAQQQIEHVRWRGHRHHRRGADLGWALGGLAVGTIIGSALAQPRYGSYYGSPYGLLWLAVPLLRFAIPLLWSALPLFMAAIIARPTAPMHRLRITEGETTRPGAMRAIVRTGLTTIPSSPITDPVASASVPIDRQVTRLRHVYVNPTATRSGQ